MIRFACLGAFLVAFALTGPAWPRGDAALAVAARHKERAFATGGRKVCPFGTCARPHPSHLPLAAHITDGVRNP
jgi:hypothetical protein